MIAGGKCNIRNLDYSLYVVRDVSDVYGQISGMTWRFVLISVVGIAVGAAVIILMVRRASRPLAQLSMAAREIAAGDYAKRTEAHTHDEVGQLAADFNRMADAVETRIEQLEETARRQRLFYRWRDARIQDADDISDAPFRYAVELQNERGRTESVTAPPSTNSAPGWNG